MNDYKDLKGEILSGELNGTYFITEVPLFSGGQEYDLYRIFEKTGIDQMYFKIIPSKYDKQKGKFLEHRPVEVFLGQHLEDRVFSES